MSLNNHIPVRWRMKKYISVDYKLNWIFHFVWIEKIMMIFFLAYQYFLHSQLKKKAIWLKTNVGLHIVVWCIHFPMYIMFFDTCVTRKTFYYLCDWYFWQAMFRMYKVQQWRLWSGDQRSRCPSQTPRENQGAYKMVTWYEVQIWIWEGT